MDQSPPQPESRQEQQGTAPDQVEERPEPSLGALILANLKVLGGVAIFIAAAWGLWFLVAKLFPEVDWLQSG